MTGVQTCALPICSDTQEQGFPASVTRVAAQIAAADGVLIISPEYNYSIPGVLKNAIDWLSRPYGAGALSGKPVAVVGTAFGQYGGVWAQDEARKAATVAGAAVLNDAKLSIPSSVVRFAETHPADDTEVVAGLTEVIEQLSRAGAGAAA